MRRCGDHRVRKGKLRQDFEKNIPEVEERNELETAASLQMLKNQIQRVDLHWDRPEESNFYLNMDFCLFS